jgi:hypothetical protein
MTTRRTRMETLKEQGDGYPRHGNDNNVSFACKWSSYWSSGH